MLFEENKIMEKLIRLSQRKRKEVSGKFKRFLIDEIDMNERLIMITGFRGTGKTTMLLQMMYKEKSKAIYLSMDHLFFEANTLIETLDSLYEKGYRVFYLDEIHRYARWSADLKNARDQYSDIYIRATGSSVLEIEKGNADLSRRAAKFTLPQMSLREFAALSKSLKIAPFKLDDIVQNHTDIAAHISDKTDVLKLFAEYLKHGCYPFYNEGVKNYTAKLTETTSLVLDVDIPAFEELNFSTVHSMKKLLYVVAQSVPFQPNVSKLAGQLNITRNTLLKLLHLLNKAGVISMLHTQAHGISYLRKPDKIYLQNPNLSYAIGSGKPDKGNLRETFFLGQSRVKHRVTTPSAGDFLVDDRYVFEVGGQHKTNAQIKGMPQAYIAADGIKGGGGNRIPLWLFGFLY